MFRSARGARFMYMCHHFTFSCCLPITGAGFGGADVGAVTGVVVGADEVDQLAVLKVVKGIAVVFFRPIEVNSWIGVVKFRNSSSAKNKITIEVTVL